MKQKKGFMYAYIAGVFDADGSVYIGRYIQKGTPTHRLYLKLAQRQKKVVEFVGGVFGGVVKNSMVKNGSGDQKEMWQWCTSGDNALEVLKRIHPFMKGKKKQAEVAIRFQKRMVKQKQNPRTGRLESVPKHEIDRRENEYQFLKWLKKNPNCADVETEWANLSKRESDSPVLKEEVI